MHILQKALALILGPDIHKKGTMSTEPIAEWCTHNATYIGCLPPLSEITGLIPFEVFDKIGVCRWYAPFIRISLDRLHELVLIW